MTPPSEAAPRTIITGCAIATVDPAGTEHASGHLVIEGSRIVALGAGSLPADLVTDGATIIDGTGLLATPGLVNSHHHLYQWATRGFVADGTLFEWLTGLYPVWAQLDPDITHHAAKAGLSALALSGCTLSMDHHYVFPNGTELLESTVTAAQAVGIRFHPTRGSMNLGKSQGGLPPDSVTETHDAILQASADAIDRWHDPSPESVLQVALAPCSPFSVTAELMAESAELARKRGVRLHTHLCETLDEEAYCLEHFGARPADYVGDLGWMGDDVWFAHCVHLSDEDVDLFGRTGVGVAHCPTSNARLGSGIARTRDLRNAGVAVGLGVDGAASNEAGTLQLEVHASLMASRFREGPDGMTVRQALAHGTIHGARCLGREADLGSLEVGKLADIALWKVDDLGGAGIIDPVAALVLGPPRGAEHVLVGGKLVVEGGELRTTDLETVTSELVRVSARQAAAMGAA
ncbi:MAG: 8-oxoguanine deaminase [Solirubrobacteraceae bacterium]|nr:8-oxoguanine deaminase [Solirubrobacteraceae bacterium]